MQRPGEGGGPTLRLLGLAALCVLGALWWLQEPVPDWRQALHSGALAIAGGTVLVTALPVARRSGRPWLVGGAAAGTSLWLLGLAVLAVLSAELEPCDVRVHPTARPDAVTVERFCRYWASSAGDCSHRRHPVRAGLFLGPPEPGFLPCG